MDVNKIATSLMDMQRSDGTFGDEEEDDGSILSTGYALEALANLMELDKVGFGMQCFALVTRTNASEGLWLLAGKFGGIEPEARSPNPKTKLFIPHTLNDDS